jgi:signal transduction histidine kinase
VTVTVALMSSDQRLSDLCHAILAERSVDSRPLLVLSEPRGPLPNADFYIWDYMPELDIALRLATRDPHRHILLVERSCLAGANGSDFLGLKLVLKPVTKVALATWLAPAAADSPDGGKQPLDPQHKIISSLVEANVRLQEYELDRSSFLAHVTHDFRAPLTAMNGYCELLLAEALGPLTDIQREVLGRTLNSLKRLTRMSSAMLQLTSNSTAGRPLSLQEGQLHDCIHQAIHELQPMIGDKQIQVTANLKSAPPGSLHFDAGQLERVFINLLENACKFTPQGGHIEVRGAPYFWDRRSTTVRGLAIEERRVERDAAQNAFRVDVCNTGPGIAPDYLGSIFDEYTSYGEGSNGVGSGLGLAICKLIVEEHRGRIWAENHSGGPVLSFVLPLERQIQSNVKTNNGSTRKIG